MVKILKKHSSNTTEQAFCLPYYSKVTIYPSSIFCSIIVFFFFATDKCIYFEKLTCYNSSLFRSIHASSETPMSPRKLVEYVKEVPKILAWKRAVVDHTVGLK